MDRIRYGTALTMPDHQLNRDNDELSVLEVASTLLRNWRLVVGLPLILALVVGIVSVLQSPTYSASAAFVPDIPEGRSMGGAVALAQQFGLNLGSGGNVQSPEFYVDLLHSTAILRETVDTRYQVPENNGGMRTGTLVDFYEVGAGEPHLPPWRVAAKELDQNISTAVDRETGVVRLTVSATSPDLAEQVAQRLLTLLNSFHLEVRQNQALEESRFIGDRVAEARDRLMEAEAELQSFLNRNREFSGSPELVFQHERLQRQVAIRQDVYTSLLRAEEEAQIDAVRDTPLFAVIDHPQGTAEPEGSDAAARAILAFCFGFLVAAMISFARELGRRTREAQVAKYREFEELARGVLHDVRHPSRWFSST